MQELSQYFECISLSPQTTLFQEGERLQGLYWLCFGQITTFTSLAKKKSKRLCTYKAGNIIGETGIYNEEKCSYSAIADTQSQVYFLSQENFQKLEEKNTILANIFHKFIVKSLAERLKHKDYELKHLLF